MLDRLTARLPAMLDDLATLVSVESPTPDLPAVAACARAAADLGTRLLGAEPEWLEVRGRPHLRWRFGAADRVLLLGHLDTVWPLGTTDRWPLRLEGDRAHGPGTFDMKAGVVQLLHALAALDSRDGVAVLLTTDEETGSATSRALIEEEARRCASALVLEGAAEGAVKTARKGVSMYRLDVHGRAAHAGLEPEKGVNATVELAHQVLAIAAMGNPALGTSVTPTAASSGTTGNTVPAAAALDLDARAWTVAEQERVDVELRALQPALPGARLELSGGPNRPPMERELSAQLYERAVRLASELGLGALPEIAVGGGSDGNFTAGVGTPTLDGLGAVGAGAHADDEHVVISELPRRAALVAALVDDLR